MRFMGESPEAGRLGEHLSLWEVRHRIETDGDDGGQFNAQCSMFKVDQTLYRPLDIEH
jgi:hypothetical protein